MGSRLHIWSWNLVLSLGHRVSCRMELVDDGFCIVEGFHMLQTEDGFLTQIKQYVEKTHGDTHSYYKLDVQQVFKVKRADEDERFQPVRIPSGTCILIISLGFGTSLDRNLGAV